MRTIHGWLLIFSMSVTPVFAQVAFSERHPEANPISEKIVGKDAGVGMGWLFPSGRLVLDGEYKEVRVYTDGPREFTAVRDKVLEKGELKALREKHCMPCGEPQNHGVTYHEYKVEGPGVEQAKRVLVSPRGIPEARLGFKPAQRTKFLLRKAAGILGIGKGQLHKYRYLQTLDGKFVYSFHAFYDPKTKELRRSGIMLEKRGVLLASEAVDHDPNRVCDGCGTPTYGDPLDFVYRPINLIETSVLPCPLVLMDTGTIEGRALSLLTFDLEGARSEVRAYEYVVHCCE